MAAPERSRPTAAALVVVATVVISVGLTLVGVPSAVLFGGLLGGMAHALTSSSTVDAPEWAYRVGQALVGSIIGTQVSLAAVRELGGAAVPILAVTAGTVLLSLGAGRLLALRHDVSPVTGVFALIAGGASGVVVVARELGADDRVVTVVQYLRVAVVLVTLPLVTALVFHPPSGVGSIGAGTAPLTHDLLYVVVTVGLGVVAARLVPVTTTILLAPLVVGAVISAAGWLGTVTVPTPLQWIAYALIGIQVGLRFTRESLTSIARMLPAVLAIIVGMVAVTAAMGAVLAWLTPVDGLTAYLATTPGGLFAVLATAADSGSDVTYVMALQLFRLVVILAFLPLLARWLRRG